MDRNRATRYSQLASRHGVVGRRQAANRQRGVVLLLSLLILAVVTAIGLGVTVIIVGELRLSATTRNGTLAFYAAESGIERALYTVKRFRPDATACLDNASCPTGPDTVSTIQSFTGFGFSNGATYDTSGTASGSASFTANLPQDTVSQVDIYNVDDSLNVSDTFDVKSVKVKCCAGPAGSEWAEVSWTGWARDIADGSIKWSQKPKSKFISDSNLKSENGFSIDLPLDDLVAYVPAGYRLRVKSVYADITNLTLKAFDSGGNEKEIPARVVVKSVGSVGDVKQALLADLPWKIPLGGLFDYVLFSEETLAKEIATGTPIYSSGVIQVEDAYTGTSCTGCTTVDACGQVGATCKDCNWKATGICSGGANSGKLCTLAADCPGATCGAACVTKSGETICSNAGGVGSCQLGNACGTTEWTLPIPDTIPAGKQYYLSVKAGDNSFPSGNFTANPGEEFTITIHNPGSVDKALPFHDQGSGVAICTIDAPDTFELQPVSGRTITFKQATSCNTTKINFDWYQISTFKLFGACSTTATTCNALDSCQDCGNDILEDPEECEPSVPITQTCSNVNSSWNHGTLSCNANCTFNTALCSQCGNGTKDGTELCDGSSLGGLTCSTTTNPPFCSGGETCGGLLQCDASCDSTNNSKCWKCGNNMCQNIPTYGPPAETCPAGTNDCPDRVCYGVPTCSSGTCNDTPTPFGQTDTGCTSPSYCDGAGNCVTPQSAPLNLYLRTSQFDNSSTGDTSNNLTSIPPMALNNVQRSIRPNKAWTQKYAYTNNSDALRGVWASSTTNDVWVVGDGGGTSGTILHSPDSGANWEPPLSIGSQNLNDVWGSGPLDLWAVGNGGVIYHNTSGTLNGWGLCNTGVPNVNLLGVFGAGGSVWAVGDGGTIVVSNGDCLLPTPWSTQNSLTANRLRDVWAASASEIWAVGDTNTVRKCTGASCTSAGTTWTSVNGPAAVNWYSVYGAGASNLYLAGGTGFIGYMYYTTNRVPNPPTWTLICNTAAVCGNANLERVHAVDTSNVFAVGTGAIGGVGSEGSTKVYYFNGTSITGQIMAEAGYTRVPKGLWALNRNKVWTSTTAQSSAPVGPAHILFGDAPVGSGTESMCIGNLGPNSIRPNTAGACPAGSGFFDNTWYSNLSSTGYSIPAGAYNLTFYWNTRAGSTSNITGTVSLGYCAGGVNCGTVTTLFPGTAFSKSGAIPSTTTVNIGTLGSASSCGSDCRIWVRVQVTEPPTGWFSAGLNGTVRLPDPVPGQTNNVSNLYHP